MDNTYKWYSVRSLKAFKQLMKELDGHAIFTSQPEKPITSPDFEHLYHRHKRKTLVGFFVVKSGNYLTIAELTQEIAEAGDYHTFKPKNKLDNNYNIL